MVTVFIHLSGSQPALAISMDLFPGELLREFEGAERGKL
jgi:hypothetical protein